MSKGDMTLKGSGSYKAKWAEYQRGSRGGQIEARKSKLFKTKEAAIKFLRTKEKSKKYVYGYIE